MVAIISFEYLTDFSGVYNSRFQGFNAILVLVYANTKMAILRLNSAILFLLSHQ